MQAILCSSYGGPEVLQLKEVAKPQPQAKQILVRVKAASVTAADTMMRRGSPYIGRLFLGLRKPKHPITGTGFAGIVEAVGSEVGNFAIGDEVFGESIFGQGSNAQYLCVSAQGVVAKKPSNLSFEEAAPVCDGALTSLSFLQHVVELKAGQRILINGAAGSLGTAAVQLAKLFGAHVTAQCSTANHALVTDLGADEVIDYKQDNFVTRVQTNQLPAFDLIYDTVGKLNFGASKPALSETGIFISPVLSCGLLGQVLLTTMLGHKKAKFSATGARPIAELRQMLGQLIPLLANGTLITVIDRSYPLHKTQLAHQYADKQIKRGNLVLQID